MPSTRSSNHVWHKVFRRTNRDAGRHMCRIKMPKGRVRSLFAAHIWRHELWTGYPTAFREMTLGAVPTAVGSWRLSWWITHVCRDLARWETKITNVWQVFSEILRASVTDVIQTLYKVNLSRHCTLTRWRYYLGTQSFSNVFLHKFCLRN
jgi:hypothetical protein